MGSNKISPDNVIHDFTRAARDVVEATIGRKLTMSFAREAQSPAASAILALVRRSNIRSTVRLTGIPRNEVKKVLLTAGGACAGFHSRCEVRPKLSELQCTALPAIRDKNRRTKSEQDHLREVSEAWTWTAIDSRSGFVPIWQIGPRDADSARVFLFRASSIAPVGERIASDGPPIYLDPSVHTESGRNADANSGILASWLAGLPNGFAEKVRRHAAMLALLFTYHNFATQNSSGISPAMAAEMTDHVWTVEELLSVTQIALTNGAVDAHRLVGGLNPA